VAAYGFLQNHINSSSIMDDSVGFHFGFDVELDVSTLLLPFSQEEVPLFSNPMTCSHRHWGSRK
jgi:hypothetical protein